MTPHQIALVREVLGSVDALDVDLGVLVLDRFAVARPDTAALGPWPALCASLTRLVGGLDRVDLLIAEIGGLADVLVPVRPSSADLTALGAALDGALAEALPAADYGPDPAEACRLAWLLVTELLHQRPAPPRIHLRA